MQMIPNVKSWACVIERAGKLIRVFIEAPTKRLAVMNYRHKVGYRDVILSVDLLRK